MNNDMVLYGVGCAFATIYILTLNVGKFIADGSFKDQPYGYEKFKNHNNELKEKLPFFYWTIYPAIKIAEKTYF